MVLAATVQLPAASDVTVPAPVADRDEPVPVRVKVGVTLPGMPLVEMVTAPVASAYDTEAGAATREATTVTACELGDGT